MTRRLLLVLLAGSVMAGCGGNGTPVRHSRQADLAWLRTYGRWSARLRSDVQAAESVRASLLVDDNRAGEFKVAVNRLGTCADRYRRHIGEPPKPAWHRPARLALEACQGFTRGERQLVRAVGHEAGDLRFSGQASLDKAGQQMYLAGSEFERSFVWNRPLPRLGGVSGRSRIEPLFSRVATPLARRPVEIRCWSADDWATVLAEYHAFTARGSDPSGFVDSSALSGASDSANIDSWVCAHLSRLAYRHYYPASGTDLDNMAAAMQVLSHEIQHLVANGTEAQTECYGLQSVEQVARGLGASSAYARRLALRFWTALYPRDNAQYHTKLCHDAGPLDAHPSSSRWP